jgi:hypothetical protein
MIQELSHAEAKYALAICELGLENQRLLSRCLDYGLLHESKQLRQIDAGLSQLLFNIQHKTQLSNEEQQEAGYTHYVWHTQGDDRVRGAHAVNEGRLFSWNNPPVTGHPGEDYNCRCWAEPYVSGKTEYAEQILDVVQADEEKWGTADFIKHFYFGRGRPVTLPEVGHLAGLINYYFYHIVREGNDTYDRINSQVINIARQQGPGSVSYGFENSYSEFSDYSFVFGGGTVSGVFSGTARQNKGMLLIQGRINYRYDDTFTDPASIREIIRGSSEPLDASILELLVTDAYGVFYDIIGRWQTTFSAEVKIDANESIFD